MGTRVFTIYFKNIPETHNHSEIKQLFSQFGNVLRTFIHPTRSYGMIDYADISSCNKAIETLHEVPPFFLHVSMARTRKSKQTCDMDGESWSSSSVKNDLNRSVQSMSYDEDDVLYIDINNRVIENVLVDEDGTVYVPLDRVTGVRKAIRRTIAAADFYSNPGNYEIVNIENINENNQCSNYYNNTNDVKANGQFIEKNQKFQNDQNRGYQRNQQKRDKSIEANRQKSRGYDRNERRVLDVHSANNNSEEDWSCPGRKAEEIPLKVYRASQGKENSTLNSKVTKHDKFQGKQRFGTESDSSHSHVNTVKNEKRSDPIVNNVSPEKDGFKKKSEKSAPNTPKKQTMQLPKKESQKSVEQISDQQIIKTESEIVPTIYKAHESIKLPLNKFVDVLVTYIIDDTNAYVQMDEHTPTMIDITAMSINGSENPTIPSPKVGQLCLASYEGSLFRAVVLAVKPTLHVRYIDYGNECNDLKDGILVLPPKLYDIPAQAVHIRLEPGSPFVLIQDNEISIKAVRVIDDVTEVQLPNRVHNTDSQQITHQNTANNRIPEVDTSGALLLYSKLQEGYSGCTEFTIHLSEGKFVIAFLPQELQGDIDDLQLMTTDCPPSPTFKPVLGDLVAAKHLEEGWCRAILLEHLPSSKYKIAFVDFGKEAIADELRPVPKEMSLIPWFTCICTVPLELDNQILKLKEIHDMQFRVTSVRPDAASIILCCEKVGDICAAEISVWQPTVSPTNNQIATPGTSNSLNCKTAIPDTPINSKPAYSKNIKETTLKDIPSTSSNTSEICSVNSGEQLSVTEKPAILSLNNGDKVRLEYEHEGYIFVRTRKGEEYLRRINELLKAHIPSASNLSEKPKPAQLVAAFFEDGWYRAAVQSVKGDQASILYVDYGNDEMLPWREMKQLSKDLKHYPFTLSKVKLKGYMNTEFSLEEREYLANIKDNKTIVTVSYEGSVENGVTLTKDGKNVIDDLLKLRAEPVSCSTPKSLPMSIIKKCVESSSSSSSRKRFKVPSPDDPKVVLEDLPCMPVVFGEKKIRILHTISAADAWIYYCYDDESTMKYLHVDLPVDIESYVQKDIQSECAYRPDLNEIVLANISGKWRRALVTDKVADDDYLVFLVDHGNVTGAKDVQLRRISPDFCRIEIGTYFGTIRNLPNDLSQKAVHRLEQLLSKKDPCDAIIHSEDESKMIYLEIPSVIRTLLSEKLI